MGELAPVERGVGLAVEFAPLRKGIARGGLCGGGGGWLWRRREWIGRGRGGRRSSTHGRLLGDKGPFA